MKIRIDAGLAVQVPELSDIETLRVGQLAPDYAGHAREVTRIYARGVDVNGRAFVCYYTRSGNNGSVSNTMKVGELQRTLPLTCRYTSAQLDAIEEEMGSI